MATRLARHLGCENRRIVVEPDVIDLLPRLVWHMDEPTADPAIVPAYLVCREARQETTVLLSGVGGDELFAGYRKYCAHYWGEMYRDVPPLVGVEFIEPLLARTPSFRGTPLKGFVGLPRKWPAADLCPPIERFLMNCTYMDVKLQKSLLTPSAAVEIDGLDPYERHQTYFDRVRHADFLNQMLYLDTKIFMTSLNLNYADKMGMASSVEVRVPFLDRGLAEFVASSVSPQAKLHGRFQPVTKHILRKAVASCCRRKFCAA